MDCYKLFFRLCLVWNFCWLREFSLSCNSSSEIIRIWASLFPISLKLTLILIIHRDFIHRQSWDCFDCLRIYSGLFPLRSTLWILSLLFCLCLLRTNSFLISPKLADIVFRKLRNCWFWGTSWFIWALHGATMPLTPKLMCGIFAIIARLVSVFSFFDSAWVCVVGVRRNRIDWQRIWSLHSLLLLWIVIEHRNLLQIHGRLGILLKLVAILLKLVFLHYVYSFCFVAVLRWLSF